MADRPNFNERRRLALGDFRQQVIEAQSQLSSLILVAENGEEFEIPHPMLISDDAQKRLETVQTGEDLDKDEDGLVIRPNKTKGKLAEPLTIRTAKALLGEAEHKRFIAAGGHSNDVTLAWQMLVEEQTDRQEADPK
jgi:hypothetical protein